PKPRRCVCSFRSRIAPRNGKGSGAHTIQPSRPRPPKRIDGKAPLPRCWHLRTFWAARTRACACSQSRDWSKRRTARAPPPVFGANLRGKKSLAFAPRCSSFLPNSRTMPLLSGGDRSLRLAAQYAVARFGGALALQALRPLLTNSSPEIRREAVVAVGQLRDRNAVPDLLRAWRSPETREAARAALAEAKD